MGFTVNVLLGSLQNVLEQLLFRIANGWVPPKIQTAFLEHQWTPQDGRVGFRKEMSNCSKAMLMSNNRSTKKKKKKKEY